MKAWKIVPLFFATFLIGMLVGVATWQSIQPTGEVVIVQTKTVTTTIAQAKPSITYEIYFSPNGGCEERLVHWIGRANSTIHAMIYSFTLDSIGDALIAAHNRGVEVKVVMEKEQLSEYSEYEKLKTAGIDVRIDSNPALMHNKIAIIDGIIVITGSYNWSKSAETKNNENMIIVKSVEFASVYENEFQIVWSNWGVEA